MNASGWVGELGLDSEARASRLGFLELGADDRAALGELGEAIEGDLGDLVVRWHDYLLGRPETRALMARAGDHLGTVQVRYFRSLFAGRFDEAYFESRLRIGFVHAEVGLAPPWYLGAYRKFVDLVRGRVAGDPGAARWLRALDKAVSLDLQLALDAYFFVRTRQLRDARRSLALQLERAEAAARAKEEFLSKVSHELRTPLHAILGFADLVADGIEGPVTDAQRASLAKVRVHGERLIRMIDQLLDAARMAAAGLAAPVAFDPGPVLAAVAERARGAARAKGLELRFRVFEPVPRVVGDPDGFALALGHLLENAVRFTRAGRVELAVDRLGERVRFRVRDTGPGIAPEHRGRIFDAFHQVDAGDTRSVSGLGMGLTLARQAVDRMGGTLELAETGPGGSEFCLELPAADPA